MHYRISQFIAISLTLFVSLQAVHSQETATAVTGDLTHEVNIPGVFVADDKDEIKMEPSKYQGDLIITRILPEGVDVKKGDVLMEFDTDNVDDAIEEAQNEVTDAEVELKKADAEYQTAKIELESSQDHLKTELEHLNREVQAAVAKQQMDLEGNEKKIVDAEYQLSTTITDFETLKDIYNDRSIQNSPSGDILFDREKKKIENREKRIDFLKKELDYFKKFDKTKTQLEKELAVEKKHAEIKKQKVKLLAAVAEKEAVVIKAQRKLDAANKKVEGLKLDRSQLKVISPRDGVLFYGQTGNELPAGIVIIGGGPRDIRSQLRIGGRVSTHRVLQTVSTMDHLSIKMNVTEGDIQHLANGLSLTVFPDAFPTKKFAGKLVEVGQVATKVSFSSNVRRFKVMGKCTDEAPELRSGMNCRVAIHARTIKNAVLVPVSCVFADGDQLVCYVKSSGVAERREVQIGASNPDQVQITSGIEPGDVVLLSRPQ